MPEQKSQIKFQQLEIHPDADKPFAEDKLDRKVLCEDLTNIIENAATPYTLAVNAGWGNGKTVFLQMLRAHLRKQGYGCVLFDAWRADFYKDALPALIGEIKEQIKPNRTLSNKAKNLSKALIPQDTVQVIALLAKAAKLVAGEAGEEIVKAINRLLRKHDAIEHYRTYQKALKDFKDALKKAAASNGKPLVILVDELDRCRPDFALDVLEKVKHVFDVESVFFVFALNKEQLERTIEKTYGEIGAELYLRKFFDLTIPLVNVVNEADLVTHMVEKIGLDKLIENSTMRDRKSELIKYLGIFFEMFNHLSLRDREQVIAIINLFFLMKPSNQHHTDEFYPMMLAYFPIIKLAKPELFQKSKDGADRNNPEAFPFEEHLQLYKNQAGFEKTKDMHDEPYEKYQGLYFYLHLIYYQMDNRHKEYVRKRCEEGKPEDLWPWCRIIEYQGPPYANWRTKMGYVSAFINKIDSIGKLVARPEEAEKNQ